MFMATSVSRKQPARSRSLQCEISSFPRSARVNCVTPCAKNFTGPGCRSPGSPRDPLGLRAVLANLPVLGAIDADAKILTRLRRFVA